jgi:hypothetical protein
MDVHQEVGQGGQHHAWQDVTIPEPSNNQRKYQQRHADEKDVVRAWAALWQALRVD